MESEFGLRVIVEAITECHVQTECHENGNWILSPNSRDARDADTKFTVAASLVWVDDVVSPKGTSSTPGNFKARKFRQNTATNMSILPNFGCNHTGSCIFLSWLLFFSFFFAQDHVKDGEKQQHFRLETIVDVLCGTSKTLSVVRFWGDAWTSKSLVKEKIKSAPRKRIESLQKVAEPECKWTLLQGNCTPLKEAIPTACSLVDVRSFSYGNFFGQPSEPMKVMKAKLWLRRKSESFK